MISIEQWRAAIGAAWADGKTIKKKRSTVNDNLGKLVLIISTCNSG